MVIDVDYSSASSSEDVKAEENMNVILNIQANIEDDINFGNDSFSQASNKRNQSSFKRSYSKRDIPDETRYLNLLRESKRLEKENKGL